MLNANMAFLSIDTVDKSGSQDGVEHSAMKFLSYISVFLSFGAILSGLNLLRQLRISGKSKVQEAHGFLENNYDSYFGLESPSHYI